MQGTTPVFILVASQVIFLVACCPVDIIPALFVQMKIKIESSNFQRAFSEDFLSQTKLDTVEVV